MKTEYEGIEIEYNENANDWHCVIRDRHRTFQSLRAAKDGIDKQPPEKREKFEPIAVLSRSYEGKIYAGAITSFTEGHGGNYAWVTWQNRGRSKDVCSGMVLDNQKSREAYERIAQLEAQRVSLRKEIDAEIDSLETPRPLA